MVIVRPKNVGRPLLNNVAATRYWRPKVFRFDSLRAYHLVEFINWRSKMAKIRKSGFVVAAAAAALFASGTVAALSTSVHADDSVKCFGVNACKGQSQCRTAQSQCNGHNKCAGKGWIRMDSAAACEAEGGRVG